MTTAKGNLLLSGDCLEVLKTLKDNSVDAVVTDPPYGLGDEPDIVEVMRDWVDHGYHEVKSKKGFMGKEWDAFVPQPVVWREVFRVLKPGGLHRGSGSTVGSFTGEHDISSEPEGRFPANLIHDGSDEVVRLFPDSKGSQTDTKPSERKPNNIYGKYGPRPAFESYKDTGSAARFFYCAKASKSERGEGNVHPTVKPLALMRYLCRLITPEWGTILDPFAGSGTTGAAAIAEDFGVILIEREAEYLPIIEKRLNDAENAA